MTIRITPNFTIRRAAGRLTVFVTDEAFTAGISLNADQARDAADAFNVVAIMMDAANDDYVDGEPAASRADSDYQLAKEEAA